MVLVEAAEPVRGEAWDLAGLVEEARMVDKDSHRTVALCRWTGREADAQMGREMEEGRVHAAVARQLGTGLFEAEVDSALAGVVGSPWAGTAAGHIHIQGRVEAEAAAAEWPKMLGAAPATPSSTLDV